MKQKTLGLLCAIISALIMFTSLFCFNYIIKSSIYNNKTEFGMSINYHKLIKMSKENIKFEDIINLDQHTNVTIISVFSEFNYLGIYDPAYFYASQNSIIVPGVTRYFSLKDYRDKIKSGIYVKEVDNFYGLELLDSLKSSLVDDFIFHINSRSILYKKDIQYIINLASLPHMGDVIYIDSDNREDSELLVKKFVSLGYKDEEKEYNYFSLFLQEIMRDKHSNLIFIQALFMYPLFYMKSNYTF